jgi:hypothetical protein
MLPTTARLLAESYRLKAHANISVTQPPEVFTQTQISSAALICADRDEHWKQLYRH